MYLFKLIFFVIELLCASKWVIFTCLMSCGNFRSINSCTMVVAYGDNIRPRVGTLIAINENHFKRRLEKQVENNVKIIF